MTSTGATPKMRAAVALWMSSPPVNAAIEPGVGGEVGDAAQLDLVVVGDEQLAAGRGDERLAEQPALLPAHRDVVQVGRSELSRPVRATVWLNVAWIRPSAATSAEQPLAVGAAQLLDLAVLQQRRR